MRVTLKYICILAAATLTLAGCRSHKDLQRTDGGKSDSTAVVVRPKPHIKPNLERLDSITNSLFATYCANFSCTVDGITMNGQIRIAKDSIIWVSISKIIEVGRAKLTPDRAQAYAKIIGKQYDGDYEGLKKKLGLDADYATLEALLTGNCPPDCHKLKEPKRTGDTITLWFSQGKEQRQLTLKKSYSTRQIAEADLYSPLEKQRLQIVYGERKLVNGQMLPTSIGVKINSRQVNEQTVIKLEKIKLNEKLSFPFK